MPHDFQADIDAIVAIDAVPSILDVVCQMTGMGFAAVARVTEGRWIACAVQDEIAFGLKPGGELKVETTICHEVHGSRQAVVIDDVPADEAFCSHPTPALYGFRSYASFPIELPDGSFFGTLCAIDPHPRKLHDAKTIGTFKLFAKMIAHHLDANQRLIETRNLLEERREWERQQRVLQREATHRMKNTLAMVQAVVTQSLRNATNIDEAARTVSARIQALGRAQDMLTETAWETADIREVVQAAIAPHTDGSERFVIEGGPADLSAQQSMGLALAIHEMSTNAAKYGALSNQNGRVHLAWQVEPDRTFRFDWRESGGPPVVLPLKKGFGSRLTERVVPTYFAGRAELDYANEGVRYRLNGTL